MSINLFKLMISSRFKVTNLSEFTFFNISPARRNWWASGFPSPLVLFQQLQTIVYSLSEQKHQTIVISTDKKV